MTFPYVLGDCSVAPPNPMTYCWGAMLLTVSTTHSPATDLGYG
jgi:hypothetical protein